MVAGPNGAGKSTFAAELVGARDYRLLNPDLVCRAARDADGFGDYSTISLEVQTKDFIAAANEVEDQLERAITLPCERVIIERALSSPKDRPLVNRIGESAGHFRLAYTIVARPDECIRRVATRVRLGGHPVPPDKIRSRYGRSLESLPWFASRAGLFVLFDNSDRDPDNPSRTVAFGGKSHAILVMGDPPDVLREPIAVLRRLVRGRRLIRSESRPAHPPAAGRGRCRSRRHAVRESLRRTRPAAAAA